MEIATISQAQILEIIAEGRYRVDTDLGLVYSGKTGKEVYTWNRGKHPRSPHKFVRLHYKGKRIGIARARLVWMVANNSTIPDGWEIHHRNTDPVDDRDSNLLCLHKNDHKKFHHSAEPETQDAPF